jgi:CBS domain-containing protein
LRAILWRRTGNIKQATRMAGVCGVLIAAMLILFGIYIMISPNWKPLQPYFMGGWSILVGLFLLDTAAKVVKGARDTALVMVADAMSPAVPLDPRLSVTKLVDDVLPLHRQTSFPVAVNGRLQGILSLEDLKTLPREQWARTTVESVMRPVNPRLFVESSTTLDSAQEVMKQNGVGAVAVIDSRDGLIGFLHTGKIRRLSKKKTR